MSEAQTRAAKKVQETVERRKYIHQQTNDPVQHEQAKKEYEKALEDQKKTHGGGFGMLMDTFRNAAKKEKK